MINTVATGQLKDIVITIQRTWSRIVKEAAESAVDEKYWIAGVHEQFLFKEQNLL